MRQKYGYLNQTDETTASKSREFELVLYFVFAFLVFAIMILIIPPVFFLHGGTAINSTEFMQKTTEVMQYQKDLLTVIIAAFSAWIGAGAAYFFGRENLKVATEKMLEMRQLPPAERLRQLSVQEIVTEKNKVVDWTVTKETNLCTVYQQLVDQPFRWFIPVIDKKTGLTHVIDEEGVYRYIITLKGEPDTTLKSKTIGDLINYFEDETKADDDTRNKVLNSWVRIHLQSNAGYIEDTMTLNKVHLAIITDEKNQPLYYITAGDIKRCLLS